MIYSEAAWARECNSSLFFQKRQLTTSVLTILNLEALDASGNSNTTSSLNQIQLHVSDEYLDTNLIQYNVIGKAWVSL
jgi:hypothetical protein